MVALRILFLFGCPSRASKGSVKNNNYGTLVKKKGS